MGTRLLSFLRKGKRALLIGAGIILSSLLMASPASAGTQNGTSKTVVLRPLSFVWVQDLDFGQIIPGATTGVVRIFPNGTRTGTGGVTLVGTGFQPARFAGDGRQGQAIQVSLSSNTISLTGPGTPMTASLFEIGSTPTAILTTVPTVFVIGSPTGIFNFPLGAQLAVNANQAPGNYSATFSVTLNYM